MGSPASQRINKADHPEPSSPENQQDPNLGKREREQLAPTEAKRINARGPAQIPRTLQPLARSRVAGADRSTTGSSFDSFTVICSDRISDPIEPESIFALRVPEVRDRRSEQVRGVGALAGR